MGIALYPSMFAIKHVRVENASVGIDVVGEVPQKLVFLRETLDGRLELSDAPLIFIDGLRRSGGHLSE